MSHLLIDHNPVLQRLQDDGFQIEVRDGCLIVHDVPYLCKDRNMKSGILIMALDTSGDMVIKPNSHTAYWIGEIPYNTDGSQVSSLINSECSFDFGHGLVANYFLSCYPDSRQRSYEDYYDKVLTYYLIISSPAKDFDSVMFNSLLHPVVIQSEESPLVYQDTNASRACIVGLNKRMIGLKVAIIGMGGTGSYLLDYLAKCPVSEIHIYDDDNFNTHNAFRAPGAPPIESLRKQILKVNYFSAIYGRMHRCVVPHNIRLSSSNIDEVKDCDYVFLCVDSPNVRRTLAELLIDRGITFIDSGLGIELQNNLLTGLIRITTASPVQYSHLRNSFDGNTNVDVNKEDPYASNIQIAELNSLAAIFSIIKWKRLLGFYADETDESDLNFIFSIGLNKIFSDAFKN